MDWQVRINIWGRAAAEPSDWTPPEKRINRIYYIHGGKGFYELDGELHPFEYGKLYLLPDTTFIQVSQDPSDPMDHTFFDFDVIPGFSFQNMITIEVEEQPMIKRMMQVFQELINSYNGVCTELWCPAVLAVANSLLSALLFMISNVQDLSATSDTRILNTVSYIQDHFEEELSVEMLAARVFLDKNYFIRLFSRNTGQTPHVYIRNRRMHYAMTLLQHGVQAKDVSQKCGYESYCAFSRAFKSYYGYSPSEWKKKALGF